jgi:hypothetical protein
VWDHVISVWLTKGVGGPWEMRMSEDIQVYSPRLSRVEVLTCTEIGFSFLLLWDDVMF